jgi:hypothetical protein
LQDVAEHYLGHSRDRRVFKIEIEAAAAARDLRAVVGNGGYFDAFIHRGAGAAAVLARRGRRSVHRLRLARQYVQRTHLVEDVDLRGVHAPATDSGRITGGQQDERG